MNGNGGRALAAAAVLALVGVVAVASTGSTPSGTADGRPPADILLDTFFSFALLLFVPAAALLVYGLMQRKEIAQEIASGRYRRTSVWTYLVLMGVFAAAVYFRITDFRFGLRGDAGEVVDAGAEGGQGLAPEERAHRRAGLRARVRLDPGARRRAPRHGGDRRLRARRPTAKECHRGRGLRGRAGRRDAGGHARRPSRGARPAQGGHRRVRPPRAVRSRASGLPRRPAETPEEYVARILDRLEVDRIPVQSLTHLFEMAKFSQHDVSEAMREDAIAALTQIRDELRESARRRQQEQETMAAAPGEPAAAP